MKIIEIQASLNNIEHLFSKNHWEKHGNTIKKTIGQIGGKNPSKTIGKTWKNQQTPSEKHGKTMKHHWKNMENPSKTMENTWKKHQKSLEKHGKTNKHHRKNMEKPTNTIGKTWKNQQKSSIDSQNWPGGVPTGGAAINAAAADGQATHRRPGGGAEAGGRPEREKM